MFGNNLDDDDSVTYNAIVASLIPKVIYKNDCLSICQALKSKIDKMDEKYKDAGFWISMMHTMTETNTINISGINSLAFVRCENTQNQIQPYYNTGTQNLEFSSYSQIILISSKLSNKIPPHEIIDIISTDNKPQPETEIRQKLLSKIVNQNVLEEGDALIVLNY